jgi:hypothetical protein
MTPTETPIAPVERVVLQPSGTELWEVRCPYCGRLHTHGGRPGHRVAHCGAADCYVLHLDQAIVEVGADPSPSRTHR